MKKRLALIAAVVLAVGFILSMNVVTEAGNDFAVCHMPGHAPASVEPVTLYVSLNAAAAHGAHGDSMGVCP